MATDPRARIPGVDRLLAAAEDEGLVERYGRPLVAEALREAVDGVRAEVAAAAEGADPDALAAPALYLERARTGLEALTRPSLRPVINATGVVLHTNLGRAPLAAAARWAMDEVTAGYANLEFDLASGERGSRYDHCGDLLARLTGAEAGLVVNNCAAGLALALSGLAGGRDVVVSRGELVEIGGGFRIPEVLAQAGAGLREVGATNRCRGADYEAAVRAGGVSLLLKVHRSNFRLTGFVEEATLEGLAGLARAAGIPLVHDLGSGLLVEPETLGLPPEPTPARSVATGSDLVIFSGDKLLGGPQAGLIVGRSDLIARLRKTPLCRAVRVDKATLAGLEATLRLYLDPERAREEIPVLRMLATPVEALRERARELARALTGELTGEPTGSPGEAEFGTAAVRERATVEAVDLTGRVGGGTYPDAELPSAGLRIRPGGGEGSGAGLRTGDVDALARVLREGDPALVGRVEDDALLLDLRTVDPEEDWKVRTLLFERLVGRAG